MALGNTLGSHFLALGRLTPVQVTTLLAVYVTLYSHPPHRTHRSALVDYAPLVRNARSPTPVVLLSAKWWLFDGEEPYLNRKKQQNLKQ